MEFQSLDDYRQRIAEMETEVLEMKSKLAKLRQRAPREDFEDHSLKTGDGGNVRLSELFGDKCDLIVIHNMGRECPYCTMWADGFNGILAHLENRAAFVVVSPDSPEVQKEIATSRGWRFRMASTNGTSFNKAAGFETPEGPMPGVSTFRRDGDGRICRVSKAEIQPGDDFCITWHLFDLLEGGPGDWEPRDKY